MGEKNSGVTHPSPGQDLWLPFPKPPVMDLGEQPRSPQEPGACRAPAARGGWMRPPITGLALSPAEF